MKKITLKQFAVKTDGLGLPAVKETWVGTIVGLLKSPKDPQRGATIDEIRKTIPVLDKFEQVKYPDTGDTEIVLEDAEYDILKDRVETARFTRIDSELIEMVDAINDAEDIEVEEKT